MSIERIVVLSVIGILYLGIVSFIFAGGVYISDVVFNTPRDKLAVVGLENNAQVGFAKFTTILFWIVFVPLMFGPIVYFIAPKIYRIITEH